MVVASVLVVIVVSTMVLAAVVEPGVTGEVAVIIIYVRI